MSGRISSILAGAILVEALLLTIITHPCVGDDGMRHLWFDDFCPQLPEKCATTCIRALNTRFKVYDIKCTNEAKEPEEPNHVCQCSYEDVKVKDGESKLTVHDFSSCRDKDEAGCENLCKFVYPKKAPLLKQPKVGKSHCEGADCHCIHTNPDP